MRKVFLAIQPEGEYTHRGDASKLVVYTQCASK